MKLVGSAVHLKDFCYTDIVIIWEAGQQSALRWNYLSIPQIKLISLLANLSSSPDNSELYDLVKQEKEVKIKIHEIRNAPENPGFVLFYKGGMRLWIVNSLRN